jgi:diguanylate cyclase (GGDEF)-like protein
MNSLIRNRKSRLAAISLLMFWLLLSWLIAGAVLQPRFTEVIQAESLSLNHQADSLAYDVSSSLLHLHDIPALIALNPIVPMAISRVDGDSPMPYLQRRQRWLDNVFLHSVDHHLDLASKSIGVDVLWVMNAAGDCIAASNAEQNNGFVGTNYADRSYFRMAMNNSHGYQYAMGRNSNIPGLYFSAPVMDEGRVVGVVAVKINLPRLANWINQADAFITDNYGVVVLARDPNLLMHRLPNAAFQQLSLDQMLTRYKRSAFPLLAIQSLGSRDYPQLLRFADKAQAILLQHRVIAEDGIHIYVLNRLDGIAEIAQERLNLFLLLAASGSILFLIFANRLQAARLRKQAAQEMTQTLSLLRATLESTSDGILVVDMQGNIITSNQRFSDLWRLSAEQRALRDDRILVESIRTQLENPRQFSERVAEIYRQPEQTAHDTLQFLDGRVFERDSYPQYLDIRVVGRVWNFRDISARRQAEAESRITNERLSLAIEASQLSLWDFDISSGMVTLDSHWAQMQGMAPGVTVCHARDLAKLMDVADVPRVSDALVAAMKGITPDFQQEFRVRSANGAWGWIQCMGRVVERRGDGWALRAIGTNLDVTERKIFEKQIHHLAFHDVLTGLPNRLALSEHLGKALARTRRHACSLALGMIDLDDFKPINDTWGHEAGDRLLQELARRLQGLLRSSDFLARLGGDEFVIVFEDLDEAQATTQLQAALTRLHQAVESPFEVAAATLANVGMTMGLALFPQDAEDDDSLMRQADAAMYQAKQNKFERIHWWRMGVVQADEPERAAVFEAYGEPAAQLLSKFSAAIEEVTRRFVVCLFDELALDPTACAILETLSPEERQRIRSGPADYLRFLLAPDTGKSMVIARAHDLGKLHALVGVSSSLQMQSLAVCRRLLGEHFNQIMMTSRERYQILLLAETRLQDAIQSELYAGQLTVDTYLQTLSRPLPVSGTLWIDAMRAEIDALGLLPGVLEVANSRPDSLGVFQIEAAAGAQSLTLQDILQDADYRPRFHSHSQGGNTLVARAWRTESMVTVASYAVGAEVRLWRDVLAPLGVRSGMAFPLLAEGGHPVAVVRLLGAHPHQFESPWMRQFCISLQQRWGAIWLHCRSTNAAVVPQAEAMRYRERLFAGGLRMDMQPIVDLRSGALVKVEALARLVMPDGQMIPPAVFLPLLGMVELDHLFRLGLDQALSHLAQWQETGLDIEVSVNLAPTTLLDADCPQWVEDALRRHAVAPQRLILELLESQSLELKAQDDVIAQLLGLGVKLAMDDLGSGYSSLQRLAALPFSTIKIDQSLLLRMRESPIQTLSLVSTIVQMGRDFERHIVVEGLEDEGMIEAARALGAHHGQGYGLARPMIAAEIPGWSLAHSALGDPVRIHHDLGALAYHWQSMHHGLRSHPCALQQCPLHAFLDEIGQGDSQAALWHQQLHTPCADAESAAAAAKLMDWLLQRVLTPPE